MAKHWRAGMLLKTYALNYFKFKWELKFRKNKNYSTVIVDIYTCLTDTPSVLEATDQVPYKTVSSF